MPLPQLLGGERRTKIHVVLAHQIEYLITKLVGMTPVARLAALLGNKPVRAIAIIGLKKPVDLAAAQMKEFSSLRDTQPALANLLDGLKPMQLFLRQRDKTRHDGSDKPGR